jgi:RNA polymerase sigma-70 factor (ECF subfamily)
MALTLEMRVWAAAGAIREIDTEESAWIERARLGDERAYRWLLSRYRDRAVRLAAHVLRRPDEAEDVAQEAFVKAFRSLNSFRGDGRFYTWLYHIVVRICLDRKRLARWNSEGLPLDESAFIEHTSEANSRMLVETLLDQLTPPMRAALVLRELEGLEYEEIARVLNIPVGTVRSRLNTARGVFRELWQAACVEADHV